MNSIIRSPKITSPIDTDSKASVEAQSDTVKNTDKETVATLKKSLEEQTLKVGELEKNLERLQEDKSKLSQEYSEINEKYESTTKNIDELEKNAEINGREAAAEAAQREIEDKKNEWQQAIKHIKQETSKELSNLEDDCVAIAYTAICRIIGDSATTQDQVLSVIKETLRHITSNDKQTIYVSEQDYQLIHDSGIEESASLAISDDVKYGGCIIKFGSGTLDARIDVQLDKLKAILLNVHSSQKGKQKPL